MSETVSISTQAPPYKSMDYEALRTLGLEHIEQLSRKVWTDYNIHDPGITILEALCYAITDLGYRTNFDIADLLANPADEKRKQFYTAAEVLSCHPLTENDYRKLFIGIKGVKNAWLENATAIQPPIYADCENSVLVYQKETSAGIDRYSDVHLKGLYDIIIELDEEIPSSDYVNYIGAIRQAFHQYRNLATDINCVKIVSIEQIGLCADVEVSPEVDLEDTLAMVYFKVYQFLAPDVKFYSLEELLDKGVASEDIFDGPTFEHADFYKDPMFEFEKGFIDTEELESAQLKKTIRISDLYQIIMDVEGVLAVKKLMITKYLKNNVGEWLPQELTADESQWYHCIPPCHKLLLNPDFSKITFYKKDLPFKANKFQVKSQFELLKQLDQKSRVVDGDCDLPVPEGNYYDLKAYYSVQNHFPQTYGIGEIGLPENVTALRKAQAKQLKGYLIFFDQLLANYLQQLASFRENFAVDNTGNTSYATQLLSDDSYVNDLFFASYKEGKLQALAETKTTKQDRQNRLLDHLIARFSEEFNEYALLLYQQRSKAEGGTILDYQEELINDKRNFLNNYPSISRDRGSGFNYKSRTLNGPHGPNVWGTDNVSGWAKRVASLIGINDYRQGSLMCPANYLSKIVNEDGKWRMFILDQDNTFLLESALYEEQGLLVEATDCLRDVLLIEDNFNLKADGDNYIIELYKGRRLLFTSEALSKERANERIETLLKLSACSIEGFHVIEHILLRPNHSYVDKSSLAPVSIDCESCEESKDPYSFRVSVVLPYWPKLFQDMNFRDYIERVFRREAPAEVYVKICWIDYCQMKNFEGIYQKWLTQNNPLLLPHCDEEESLNPLIQSPCDVLPREKDCTSGIVAQESTTTELINILYHLRNIYPAATLHDCEEGGNENPVLLNRTILGQF